MEATDLIQNIGIIVAAITGLASGLLIPLIKDRRAAEIEGKRVDLEAADAAADNKAELARIKAETEAQVWKLSQDTLEQMRKDVAELRVKVATLETENGKLKAAQAEDRERIRALEAENAALTTKVKALEAENKRLKDMENGQV